MKRNLWLIGSLVCVSCGILQAQTTSAPYPPFTPKEAELGKQLVAKSLELRKQITDMSAPADPFKIIGNLYFVGVANGEAYLLTSPQGDILMGAAMDSTSERVEKNIESLGFKMSDIKVILLNHNHGDQSGGAAYLKEKSGAQVMAAFAEIPFLEHGMFNPPAIPVPPTEQNGKAGQGARRGPPHYPPVKVDRALFNGDVVKVGPLSVTAYLIPGHSPASTTFAYTVRDHGRNYKVVEFCCWEYPADLSQNAYITEASVRNTFETFRKLYPVDIYLETGSYAWSGMLNQPSGTFAERMARLKTDSKPFVDREIFNEFSAAREVEIEEKMGKLSATNH
ncbi:MAG TPA: MBL fold metallo-hydrolase [Bryobacteraceae bacterium]|nr:MBL fold metallo-hydrolase [Bryobacteraceae bacterium]